MMTGAIIKLSYDEHRKVLNGGITGSFFIINKNLIVSSITALSTNLFADTGLITQVFLVLPAKAIIEIKKDSIIERPNSGLSFIWLTTGMNGIYRNLHISEPISQGQCKIEGFLGNVIPKFDYKWVEGRIVINSCDLSPFYISNFGTFNEWKDKSVKGNDLTLKEIDTISLNIRGVIGLGGGPVINTNSGEIIGVLCYGEPEDVFYKERLFAISSKEVGKLISPIIVNHRDIYALIKPNSVLGQIEQYNIENRMLKYYHPTVHIIRFIDIAYRRLVIELHNHEVNRLTSFAASEITIIEIMTMIDNFHRLRCILEAAPGFKKKEATYQLMTRSLALIKNVRNFFQHYNSEIGLLAQKNLPVIGYVSWVHAKTSGGFSMSMAIPGLVKNGSYKAINPVGKKIRAKVDHITYFIGDFEVNISDIYYNLVSFVKHFENQITLKYELSDTTDVKTE